MTLSIHPGHWSESGKVKHPHTHINTTRIREITWEAGASFKNQYEPQGGNSARGKLKVCVSAAR